MRVFVVASGFSRFWVTSRWLQCWCGFFFFWVFSFFVCVFSSFSGELVGVFLGGDDGVGYAGGKVARCLACVAGVGGPSLYSAFD